VIVTHQKRTMDAADVLYGVSMGNGGVTKVISKRLTRADPGKEPAETAEAA
jgi:chromosome segregation protein